MKFVKIYHKNLKEQIDKINPKDINFVSGLFVKKLKKNKKIYICGNGGSAANADHISNDLMLGLNKKKEGFSIVSLSSNIAKISCIGNDLGYDKIYSHQINEICQKQDLLIVLSGSGNSKNIVNAVKTGKKRGMTVLAVLGFDGGIVKKISDKSIHFKIHDMQVSEDMQMIFFNSVMKNLIINFKKK